MTRIRSEFAWAVGTSWQVLRKGVQQRAAILSVLAALVAGSLLVPLLARLAEGLLAPVGTAGAHDLLVSPGIEFPPPGGPPARWLWNIKIDLLGESWLTIVYPVLIAIAVVGARGLHSKLASLYGCSAALIGVLLLKLFWLSLEATSVVPLPVVVVYVVAFYAMTAALLWAALLTISLATEGLAVWGTAGCSLLVLLFATLLRLLMGTRYLADALTLLGCSFLGTAYWSLPWLRRRGTHALAPPSSSGTLAPEVFLSAADEDQAIAEPLARELRRRGIGVWYYKDTGVPGVPYPLQVVTGIDSAKAFILVVSLASTQSVQVTSELLRAFERGLLIMPLLLDTDIEQLAERRPDWMHCIGGAHALEMEESDLSQVIPRLLAGLSRGHGADGNRQAGGTWPTTRTWQKPPR